VVDGADEDGRRSRSRLSNVAVARVFNPCGVRGSKGGFDLRADRTG
jgi:hypothetical protein